MYKPDKNTTEAYTKSGVHEYYGKAPAGSDTTKASWSIFKMEYTGDNWVLKYPEDPITGLGTDAPKFIWDDVLTYTFRILGTKV